MTTQTYIEWTPYRLTLRSAIAPNGGTWRQLDEYQRHLDSLRLVDPTKASALRVAAEHVRDAAAANNKLSDSGDLDERVAAGELSAQDALKMMAKRPNPEEAQKQQRKRQDDADTLTGQLLHKAVLAINGYDWLGALKPLAAAAVERRAQGSWDRVHAFAEWLRDPRAKVCALGAAMADHVQDADPWLYQFGDAGRGLYLWRVEHSGAGQAVPGTALPLPNGGWRVAMALKHTAPLPTIADIAEHDEKWGGAGLYSADEVIENMNRALTAQDAEIDALMELEPTPGNKRRVVMT
jgi:hypothetical protein